MERPPTVIRVKGACPARRPIGIWAMRFSGSPLPRPPLRSGLRKACGAPANRDDGAGIRSPFRPPRPLPKVVLILPDGRAAPAQVLRGACREPCLAALAEMHRVRLALDKDAARTRTGHGPP